MASEVAQFSPSERQQLRDLASMTRPDPEVEKAYKSIRNPAIIAVRYAQIQVGKPNISYQYCGDMELCAGVNLESLYAVHQGQMEHLFKVFTGGLAMLHRLGFVCKGISESPSYFEKSDPQVIKLKEHQRDGVGRMLYIYKGVISRKELQKLLSCG